MATEAYCVKCRTKREMKDPQEVTMQNGRPATKGTCPVCGTSMFRIGSGSGSSAGGGSSSGGGAKASSGGGSHASSGGGAKASSGGGSHASSGGSKSSSKSK